MSNPAINYDPIKELLDLFPQNQEHSSSSEIFLPPDKVLKEALLRMINSGQIPFHEDEHGNFIFQKDKLEYLVESESQRIFYEIHKQVRRLRS